MSMAPMLMPLNDYAYSSCLIAAVSTKPYSGIVIFDRINEKTDKIGAYVVRTASFNPK
ncbi:hypothetical protein CPS_0224 [Colwellia psychrerythraea 34H]|jgi:hypothetical protein|uniref:Uncharacterized protein n=1 Tax=Colwellia psychrerythraea (strain 34H / ATCC BAA-681) TaxID=167879 RepID=Q48AC2_COLP3|nr:hypothetical protein CPS_0224 [Colwellia psychrerythraea 34H]